MKTFDNLVSHQVWHTSRQTSDDLKKKRMKQLFFCFKTKLSDIIIFLCLEVSGIKPVKNVLHVWWTWDVSVFGMAFVCKTVLFLFIKVYSFVKKNEKNVRFMKYFVCRIKQFSKFRQVRQFLFESNSYLDIILYMRICIESHLTKWQFLGKNVFFNIKKAPHLRGPLWAGLVRRSAGKRKDAGSTYRFGSPFSSKIVIYGHCLVTFPCTVNKTLK